MLAARTEIESHVGGDARAHPSPPTTLQAIIDELRAILGLPVAIWEAKGTHDAGAPSTARGAPPTPPVSFDLRLPVRGGGGVLGYVAVDTGGRSPLPSAHLDAIDAGVALARRVLDDRVAPTPIDRDDVFSDLLAPDPAARRAALATARARRWLPSTGSTVVRSVLIGPETSTLQGVAFGRHVGTLRAVPVSFAGIRDRTLLVVGPGEDAGVDTALLREATGRGIRILGIGTAVADRHVDDLAGSAGQAVIAAELSASLPGFHPSVRSEDLGGWLLVACASVGPSALTVISPAAHFLFYDSEDPQRETIETYLDVGANAAAACKLLFIHRTTLYYRLEKMPDVVRDALADGWKRTTLHLALKLVRLWESRGEI